jgi:Na+/glutamate symporter
MSTIDYTLSGLVSIVSGVAGSRAFPLALSTIEDATNSNYPEWMGMLMGPFGALIGLMIGLVWMNKRLNKAEEKNDAREKQRDEERAKREAERDEANKQLLTVVTQNSGILDRCTAVMEDVKDHLKRQ